MKSPVEDYPMEFPFNGSVKLLSIVPHPVNTYVDFCVYRFTGVREVESDDICIIIMLQVLPINFQQVVIGTKYVVDLSQLFLFPFKKAGDKGL